MSLRLCAVAALLSCSPALAETVTVATWQAIGPFEAGAREGMVHPLAAPDGMLPTTWDFSKTWPSALADGGRVGWQAIEGKRDEAGALTGAVEFELKGVDWDTREKEWGGAAVMSAIVLVGSFDLSRDALLVVDASRCGGMIAGQPFSGDPYAANVARSIVRGRKGSNEVVLMSAGYGGQRSLTFRVEVVDPAGPPVMIVGNDVLLPDLVAGRAGEGVAGVPIVNLTTEWLSVDVGIESGVAMGRTTSPWKLAPLASMKVPVALQWPAEGEPREVTARVIASTARGMAEASAKIFVRAAGEPRRETFLSRIDGSAQYYGLRPSTRGEAPGQSLILSTHGAGVDGLGQVSAYGPKDGVDIVAPTNRRPFGFDWHDWGRLDFEEVHELALKRLQPDPNRVHLTGHSMGGHGAWILGALHAGRFATVSPSAGWASYDVYTPFTARRSTWLGSPEVNALLMRGLASGRVSPLLENLLNVPVQVLHGGKDDNVPPTQARMLTGLLERLGGKVTYVEAPNEGHWSDLDLDRPGADSVDPAIMDKFWGGNVREPLQRRVVFVSPDLDIAIGNGWVRGLKARTTASEVRIEAEAFPPDRVRIVTRNLDVVGLTLLPQLGLTAPVVTVEVNGSPLRVRSESCGVTDVVLTATATGWRANTTMERPTGFAPNEHPGGLAKALFTPFVVVVPTQGDAARCEALAAIARQIATAWWVRGNGLAPLVRDTDVTDALRAERGLLLIGGPDVNAETKRIERKLLVVAKSSGARLMDSAVPGAHLACAHWQPSPDAVAQRVLVLQATSAEGDALLPGLQPVAAGLGLPDYLIATPRVRVAGFAGLAAVGFWSPEWGFDPASAWLGAGVEAPGRSRSRGGGATNGWR